MGITLLCLIWIYIFTEINNKIKSGWKSFIRSKSILFLGLIEALIIGMLACSLMGKTMLENSGILAKDSVKKELTKRHIPVPKKIIYNDVNVLSKIPFVGGLKLLHTYKLFGKYPFRIYPSILFIRSVFALFLGIVLQLLWQDKPMTEPL